MGVYIKGMEMPKRCCKCKLKYWDGEEEVCPFVGRIASIGRHDSCPIIPVLPHGRLGDMDALHKLFLEKGKAYKGVLGAMVAAVAWCIANAPTIIPAEEGE